MEWPTIQNELYQRDACLMKSLHWCINYLMNHNPDLNSKNQKCVKLKCLEMNIGVIVHKWWWAVENPRPETMTSLGLSGGWDSLIEIVLETSREEFNLSG